MIVGLGDCYPAVMVVVTPARYGSHGSEDLHQDVSGQLQSGLSSGRIAGVIRGK
jgi:hypothetical protein